MTRDEIIQEQHDADFAYKKARAKGMAKDEYVALPRDVREARVAVATLAEADRLRAANIATDQYGATMHERWVVAHERLAVMQAGQFARQ